MTRLSVLVKGMKNNEKVIFREGGGRFSINPMLSDHGTKYEIIIRPTMLCNINCIHCFLSRSNTSYGKGSIRKILSLLSPVSEKVMLTFSGGEPTLYPEFIDVMHDSIDYGFNQVILQTNGIMFAGSSLIDSMPRSGKITFFSSFPSHVKEVYEDITRSNTYHKAIKGLKNISNEYKVTLNHVVMRQNYEHLPDLIRFVAANFNLANTKVLISNVGTPSEGSHDQFFMRYDDLIPMFQNVFALARELTVGLEFTVSGDCSYPLCFYHMIDPDILGFRGMFLADGSKISYDSYDKKFYKSSKCRRCRYDENCQGFFSEYVKRFGESELRPIKR
ncbi:MAG: radical SAM protein [Candidatus Woesearchaeota archaeon]